MTTASTAHSVTLLTAQGDLLYRVALVLAKDPPSAEQLLIDFAKRYLRQQRSPTDAAEPFRELVILAEQHEQQAASARRKREERPIEQWPTLFRRVLVLPFIQRAALSGRLVLGYDRDHLAQLLGLEADLAEQHYTAALRALAPAAGATISDLTSDEWCLPLREAVMSGSGRERRDATLRTHLATCSLCRDFALQWENLQRRVDQVIREQLREQVLPGPLHARMLRLAQPSRGWRLPSWRVAWPVLVVLAIIPLIILPGFWRAPEVTVSLASEGAVQDPRELVERAITALDEPPTTGVGVWYARYRTLWYFDTTTYAPIIAERWVDRQNPARHRLQISHVDGGAPYELQLGDGSERLWYAIDPTYEQALYGEVFGNNPDDEPVLLTSEADAEQQLQASQARLDSGVWYLDRAYLEQAAQVENLQTLGRQRLNNRTVQIVSYRGASPLGPPAEAPNAISALVLLAIDIDNGMLRQVTELTGPPGSAQISRVTWQLVREEVYVALDQTTPIFQPNRAWNGLGSFPTSISPPLIEPRYPLLSAERLIALELLLTFVTDDSFWFPATPPAGFSEIYLLRLNTPTVNIWLLGDDRWLRIRPPQGRLEGEEFQVGAWNGTLVSERYDRYRVSITNRRLNESLMVETEGMTREEVIAVIESLTPLDRDVWQAYEPLIANTTADDLRARRLLIDQLTGPLRLRPQQTQYYRVSYWSDFSARTPPTLSDPYQPVGSFIPPNSGTLERWQTERNGTPVRYERYFTAEEPDREVLQIYADRWRMWSYNPFANVLALVDRPTSEEMPIFFNLEESLLWPLIMPGEPLRWQATEDGGSLVERESSIPDGTSIVQVFFDAEGQVVSSQILQQSLSGQQRLIASWEIEEFQSDVADPPTFLANPAFPEADLMRVSLNEGNTTFVQRNLSPIEARARLDQKWYRLPETSEAQLLSISIAELLGWDALSGGALSQDLLTAGVAIVSSYSLPGSEEPRLWIAQGPRVQIEAFLRSEEVLRWERSRPLAIEVSGETREAWLLEGFQYTRLLIPIGETIIIVEGFSEDFDERIAPLLTDLTIEGS